MIRAIPTEARGPKRKVGRVPCRACCLRQSIQPGSAHTPQEPFSHALLGQRARRRLSNCLIPGLDACSSRVLSMGERRAPDAHEGFAHGAENMPVCVGERERERVCVSE